MSTYRMIPFIEVLENVVITTESRSVVACVCARKPLGAVDMFMVLVVMVSWEYTCVNSHHTLCFKYMPFIVGQLCLKAAKNKNKFYGELNMKDVVWRNALLNWLLGLSMDIKPMVKERAD